MWHPDSSGHNPKVDSVILEAFSNLFPDYGVRVGPHVFPEGGTAWEVPVASPQMPPMSPTAACHLVLPPCCWRVPSREWDKTAKGCSGLVSRWCQILPGTAAVPPSHRGHLPVSTAGAGLARCPTGNFPLNAHPGIQKSALGGGNSGDSSFPKRNSAPHPQILMVPITPPDFLGCWWDGMIDGAASQVGQSLGTDVSGETG